ncbi:MarR family winged helix-turn-helix transcriptional regulator [Streptosporangium sp. 'caverna']|uniref:MarR family winged helix-turn-helix transcriptional regulator n=1 Tax=Streptosporangium sp. 'caverna' TaxID=2202249 RepID=UPI000D7E4BEF|nr:MarR family winged helix-turn-helix transcriptional regulator [Streptosporangium sp. 'caverna']AWS46898.1 MarR family transcriptional regulator [Streptosporangium sp. 'caverna']
MADERELQEAVGRFVRAFGLHQPDQTPCGRPIPVSEAHALGELARDGALRQNDLAHRLRLEKSSTSRLVTQLINRGWAERTAAPDDGRGVLVQLTPAGENAAAQLAEARAARFSALLDRVPPGERAGVLRALDILTEAIE